MKLFEPIFNPHKLTAFGLSLAIIAILTIPSTRVSANPNIVRLGARQISIVSTSADAGSQVTVSVELDSQGDEVAISFSLNFNPAILTNPTVTPGTGLPQGSTMSVNAGQIANGRIGILVDSTNAFTISPPNRQIVAVKFDVPASAPSGPSPISFVTTPTPLSVSSAFGALLSTTYQVGTVTVIGAPVTFVTVGGRVTTPSGQNLRNAAVTLLDSNGVRRLATTSSFGLYSFENVATGQSYTLTVSSKRYRFAPRVQVITGSVSNLDFIGLE